MIELLLYLLPDWAPVAFAAAAVVDAVIYVVLVVLGVRGAAHRTVRR